MDRGKVIASGTSDELKRMIRTGEKITVELIHPQADLADSLLGLPSILTAETKENRLVIKAERQGSALGIVIDYLNMHQIAYGQLYCELPTLNDVFLEITGKQLRDNGN